MVSGLRVQEIGSKAQSFWLRFGVQGAGRERKGQSSGLKSQGTGLWFQHEGFRFSRLGSGCIVEFARRRVQVQG